MSSVILTKEDTAALLPPGDIIGMVETVFKEWGRGNVVMPPKINLDMARSGFGSWSNAMPAFLPGQKAAGIKWIGGYRDNPAKGLPYIMGLIILTDPETGRTLSVMDASYISDWRTGASAAIAAKYLVNPGVKKIAVIGAGAQGKTAAFCLNSVFPGAEIAAADISAERLDAFAAEMAEKYHVKISKAKNTEDALADAGAAALLTTAGKPFIKDKWVPKGCVTLAMGSFQQTEDKLILGSDKIVVDSWGQASHRGELKNLCGSGKLTESSLYAELGFIASGKKPGRERKDERIMAVLVGLGAHDVLIASEAHKRAVKKGSGQTVSLN
jgi:ornithine cyclodeaminase/alanine dehydrogenase